MLAFDIVGDVEQHAMCRRPVTPGPSGLLQIIFQRAGDVGMNDKAHVGFVDAHAEGVGRGDDAQSTVDESFLGFLFGFRWQSGVVGRCCESFFAQELGEFFGLLARGAVGDGAAGDFSWQILGNQAADEIELFRCAGLDHVEFEVVALGTAVEQA